MKPSERIKEIREEYGTEINLDGPGSYYKLSLPNAIVKYLDQQHEQNLTPEQLQGREKFKVFKERNNL